MPKFSITDFRTKLVIGLLNLGWFALVAAAICHDSGLPESLNEEQTELVASLLNESRMQLERINEQLALIRRNPEGSQYETNRDLLLHEFAKFSELAIRICGDSTFFGPCEYEGKSECVKRITELTNQFVSDCVEFSQERPDLDLWEYLGSAMKALHDELPAVEFCDPSNCGLCRVRTALGLTPLS